MLNNEKMMFAMNDVDDDYLESARNRLGYKTGNKITYRGVKRIITFALAAALILALGITAYAIGVHSSFFRNAFGTGVPGHEAKTVDVTDTEGNVVKVENYPAEERADMDEEQAEALIGAYVSAVGQSVRLGDFTYTVREVTFDENGNGAVTVDLDNPNGHGRNPDGNYLGEKVPDTWSGYSVWSSNGTPIASHDYVVTEGYSDTHISYVYSITSDLLAEDEDIILRFGVYSKDDSREEADIVIPAAERIPDRVFSSDGLTAAVSPVGMKLCFEDACNDGAYEEYLLRELVISYKDGDRYVVIGDNIINYMSAVYDSENNGNFSITFNRLADTEALDSISVAVTHISSRGTTEASYVVACNEPGA